MSNVQPMEWVVCLAIIVAVLHKSEARCECPDNTILLLNDDNFRIVNSPDYPRYYCPGLNCTWRVIAPTNESKIFFAAENIDLRDKKDWIEFYDHTYIEEELGNATYMCTGSKKACKYSTVTKILIIRFVSGLGDNDHVGFQGTVAGHDRQLRALTVSITRYTVPIILVTVVLLLSMVSLGVCWCRNRKKPEYTLAPTSDKTNEGLQQ